MAKYSESAGKALSIAKCACERSGGLLNTEHLLLGLLNNGGEAAALLAVFNVDSKTVEKHIRFSEGASEVSFGEEAQRALTNARVIVASEGSRTVTDLALLYAILLDSASCGAKVLAENGVFYMGVKRIKELLNMGIDIKYIKKTASDAEIKGAEKKEDLFNYCKITELEAYLKERIIGQDDIINKMCGVLKRAFAGITEGARPLGSFLFSGTTGVGKTEVAKITAEFLFGSDGLIFLDMSEYAEQSAVSRLIGASPGYVGYEEGGQLTEAVKKLNRCVVLFDEIEKAHPTIYNLLLQILEEGRLTDGKGNAVSFKDTIIILTSNAGAKNFENNVCFGISQSNEENDNETKKTAVLQAIKQCFNPEFLNRLDEILIFNQLFKKDLIDIFKIMFYNLVKRLERKNIELILEPGVTDFFVESVGRTEYGARKIKREIIRQIEIPLSELILENKLKAGGRVACSVKDGETALKILLQN